MRISAHRLRHSLLAVPLSVSLGACMEWSRRPIPAPGQDRFLVGPVRVTLGDGSTVVLDNVTLGRDSVVGREHAAARSRIAIPADEVRSVEARRESPLGTLAVVALSLAAAYAALAVAMIAVVGTGS